MIINYKKLNKNTAFDVGYIPNKTGLFNRTESVSWFSKLNYKSNCNKRKIDKENIPLTAFSNAQGH